MYEALEQLLTDMNIPIITVKRITSEDRRIQELLYLSNKVLLHASKIYLLTYCQLWIYHSKDCLVNFFKHFQISIKKTNWALVLTIWLVFLCDFYLYYEHQYSLPFGHFLEWPKLQIFGKYADFFQSIKLSNDHNYEQEK